MLITVHMSGYSTGSSQQLAAITLKEPTPHYSLSSFAAGNLSSQLLSSCVSAVVWPYHEKHTEHTLPIMSKSSRHNIYLVISLKKKIVKIFFLLDFARLLNLFEKSGEDVT